MPPGPTIVTNFCSASFIWIAARVSLRPSIRIKRAGSRDLKDGLRCPDVGEESDVAVSQSLTIPQRFHAWLLERAEQTILRWIFRSAVLVALSVLAVDLANINGWIIYSDPAAAPAEIGEDSPALNLPRLVPSIFAPLFPDGGKRLVPLPQPEGVLAKPMTFELVGGGRLIASGTIMAGVSQSFAAEAERHSEYIRTVVLNSPGGSVSDALAMGRLIREKRFATAVEAGKLCVIVSPGVCRRR